MRDFEQEMRDASFAIEEAEDRMVDVDQEAIDARMSVGSVTHHPGILLDTAIELLQEAVAAERERILTGLGCLNQHNLCEGTALLLDDVEQLVSPTQDSEVSE